MSHLSRRTLLRGMGTMMALPLLDAMVPTSALAQSVKSRPIRTAYLFVPNGVNMAHWRPTTVGANYVLPEILAPLKDVRGSVSVLSGLAQMKAFANGDGPGDHARSSASWLTGVQAKKTAGSDIKVGVSADQFAAMEIGKQTKFASLELGCERGALAGNCDSGYSCAYSSAVSWRSESTPNAKEVNPRLLFERLFGSPDEIANAESLAKRQKYEMSILDFVSEDAASLRARLGTKDQQKLDEYFSSVREIEQRLAKFEQENKQIALSGVVPPVGVPRDRGEHIRLMGDMMILAFQADLTRVCTFMFANEGSNRPYLEIDIRDGHHDISHHGMDADKLDKKRQIDLFHSQQLAYILNKMQATPDGDGTLLDNSMILYGGGISDGNRHNHDDLPLLLAGRAGGKLPTAQHFVFPNRTPMTNLFISMLDAVGVRVERLGDSTGKLQGLF
ncbi:DUF1552 domain-containing protein [Kamptonema cortianum]|nr:DUF1552 domain-containing protein [Geitlerinema splendidum]MDK3156037.1 DUF1552 domain-containing protein [Kamptonema cortianum]